MDEESQVIVAAGVTQETNDKKQLIPMMRKVKENTKRLPEVVSADAGYFSETNVTVKSLKTVDLYIPPDRQKHGEKQATIQGRPPKDLDKWGCQRLFHLWQEQNRAASESGVTLTALRA